MTVRAHRRAALAVVVLLALIPGSAAAAEPEAIRLDFGLMARLPRAGSMEPVSPSIELPVTRIDPRRSFLRDHLMPRIGQQLDKLGPLDEARIPGRWPEDRAYAERLGARTRDVVRHAAGKAMRDFLLEETTLSRVMTSLESVAERVEDRAPRVVSRPGAGFKLDLAIAHGAPQLLLGRSLGSGSLRFSLGSRGDVGVRLRRYRPGHRTGMVAKLDPARERYTVSCSLGF